MSDLPSYSELLGDARVAAHATSATPVWLWSTDCTRILWANAVGAAVFDCSDPAAITDRRFDPRQGLAAQMARLAGTLAFGGTPRLEKLRGVGGGISGAVLCRCARLVVPHHVPAILVVALEPAGPKLSLAERARRLVHAVAAPDAAVAVFGAHGELLYATAAAEDSTGGQSLRRLGTELAEPGPAAQSGAVQPITITRFGQKDDLVLMATLATPAQVMPEAPLATPVETEPPAHPPLVAAPAVPDLPISADVAATASPEPTVEASAVAPPSADVVADEPPHVIEPDADVAAPDTAQAGAAEPEKTNDLDDTAAIPAASSAPAVPMETLAFERRHPLRFVWQMDSEGRFTLGSEEFTQAIGPGMAMTLGRPWTDVAGELALDPENQVARAVATRDTWSGITVSWPIEGSADRLKVEMSGLPIFDRSRRFLGYRGFGVCRDVDRINVLAQMRRAIPTFPPTSVAPAPVDEEVELQAPEAPESDAAEPAVADERPTLTLVPAAKNVVPFRSGLGEVRAPALSPVEHNAFRELARQLTARLRDNGEPTGRDEETDHAPSDDGASPPNPPEPIPSDQLAPPSGPPAAANERGGDVADERPLLDRLPVGILIYRFDQFLYANRGFLTWVGHDSLEAFAEAGGIDQLSIETEGETGSATGRLVRVAPRNDGPTSPGRLFTIAWAGQSALVLVVEDPTGRALPSAEAIETARQAENEARELGFIVEVASDAVFVVGRDGQVLSANRRAQSLFDRDCGALLATSLFDLFAPESQRVVRHQFDVLARNETDGPVTDGREVAARVRANAHVVLLMTIGRIGDTGERFCVVLRDITVWKTQEHELVAAKMQAERASRAKSDFLAKISHEIRTPLNSIIGFSDVMIEERFGPIGNERYREYLKDIRNSGEYVVSLLNDLLDLAKIEAGKLELNFVAVNLNEMVQSCVMLMQPQANREHIIIRTSLTSNVKPVLADAKSVRQIVLNLLSNSIKFTGAGGQVIVSTALNDDGSVVMRVRDTGIGMNESDLAAALEPFRQLSTAARWGSSGTGLGLPLTKALIEANRAIFVISSKINEGTLVEVTFPSSRVAGP